MTIKTKKVKEHIDNIEKEQQENRLNWEQKVDDWKEIHILQSEELEGLKKELEDKTFELKFSKEEEENIKNYYNNLLDKAEEKIKVFEEKNENTQNSLLKEQYEKEIEELKSEIQGYLNRRNYIYKQKTEAEDKAKKLEKELEEREIFIEELKKNIEILKESDKCNLDAIKVGIDFEANNKFLPEIKDKTERLEKASKIIEDKDIKISEMEQQSQQKEMKLEKASQIILDKDLQNRNLEEEIKKLQNQLLSPSKFKLWGGKIKTKLHQFKQLIKEIKNQKRELFCKVEVRSK